MAFIQYIQLRPNKGLKEATLTELDKINVVCGPNNSGKTTILECIGNRNLNWLGLKFHHNTIKKIARLTGEQAGWGSDQLVKKYGEIVESAFSNQEIWFECDSNNLWDKIIELWKSRRLIDYPRPENQFRGYFKEEFANKPKVILIPAKRRFETSKIVEAADSIRPDGSGVLNFLFSAKNQGETSPNRKKFDAICIAFHEISAGYEFEIFVTTPTNIQPPPTLVELQFRRKGSAWIKADDCGLGLQELLIFLYFALASEHEVVLIEEPENHLHPEIQRRLIAFLRKTEKQFFLSTHSSVFLNTQFADRVFTCRMTDSVRVENATSRAAALAELGYSIADNLVSDLVVLCEGPKDKLVLDEFFQKMGLLDRSNIKVWPLGGDIMDQLDLSVFQESHKLIALIDNDPGSSIIRKRFQKKCDELRIPVTRLKRYALENYFSLAAISEYMKGQMPVGITELAPDKPVADQLGFEVKKNGGKIAKEMKLEDLKGTDLEEFLNLVAKLAMEDRSKTAPVVN